MPHPDRRPAPPTTRARNGARAAACAAGAAVTLIAGSAPAQAETPARAFARASAPASAFRQPPLRAGGRSRRRHRTPPPAPAALLALGSRGRAVAEAQRALHLHPSGRYGRATRRAVVRFQRTHHLLVDGIVGPQTWDALFGIRAVAGAPAAGPASGTQAYSPTGGYAIPTAIVMCESGGNWGAVNPASGAGGAYQIMPSTWAAYGGQGLPQDASPAQQSRIAAEIWASQGPSAWSC